MLPIINPIPIIFTFATLTGVLFHDTHIDKAAGVALAPAATGYAGASAAMQVSIHKMDHVHVERSHAPNGTSAYKTSLPKIQPRDDDKRYIVNKKQALAHGGNDHSYLWPSI